MGKMHLPKEIKDDLKKNLFKKLKDKTITLQIKANIITFISIQELYLDKDYLKSIFEIFKDEDDLDIVTSIISLLVNFNETDEWFPFLYDEFLRVNNLKPFKKIRNTINSSSSMLEDSLIKLNISENFLEIIVTYLNNDLFHKLDLDFETKIYNRCLFFINSDSNFILQIIKRITNDHLYYHNDNFLKKIIRDSDKDGIVIQYLLDNTNFNKTYTLIAMIVSDNSLPLIIKKYQSGSLDTNELDYFRNYIFNTNDRKLAFEFESKIQKEGYIFNNLLFSDTDIKLEQKKHERQFQATFDILFCREQLLNQIKDIFIQKNTHDFSFENFKHVLKEWYERNGHQNTIDSSVHILDKIIRTHTIVNFETVKEHLSDDNFVIHEIYSKIKNSQRKEKPILISENQKAYITTWIVNKIAKLNFDTIKPHNNEYKILEEIYFFCDLFKIHLSDDFLLQSLQFLDCSGTEVKLFELVKDRVSKEKFNATIINNLNNKELSHYPLNVHIKYSIENKLQVVYPIINNYFLSDKHTYGSNISLQDYYENTNDIIFLKKCCDDINKNICWVAIKILLSKNLERDFIIGKAKEWLESSNNHYTPSALDVLLKYNDIEALTYIIKHLDNHDRTLNNDYFSYFDNRNGITQLKTLFNRIYGQKIDSFENHQAQNFFDWYIHNLSKINYEIYNETLSILIALKTEIEELKGETFFINSHIEKSKESYVNSQSKPLSFEEAKKKVDALNI
jgi:hypothetical protein